MLTARAAKRDHQILETSTLIAAHARIHQRRDVRQKLVNALLLAQIVDHRRIPARKRLELLFAPRIRQTSSVKNKAAAISSVVRRQAAVKRKTENADC